MSRPGEDAAMSRRKLVGVAALGAAALMAAPARAHFELQAPASWMSQDPFGSPQNLGPCGDEGGGTPSGVVTPFRAGQTVDVTVDEIIFHPGHYRIALAVVDRSELPAEPPVTAGSTLPCGTVPVQNPPVFPVLADGVLDHAQPYPGPQTVQVTLPAGITCDKCTLQVIEFMSNHGLNNPGGCFYHHCADISIQSASVAVTGGTGGGSASGTSSGGGCSVTHAPLAFPDLAGLLVLAALAIRRRRG
jgi:hypothetical protein